MYLSFKRTAENCIQVSSYPFFNGHPYNTKECAFERGYCLQLDVFIKKFPDCVIDDLSKLVDGKCDENAYNTAEYGNDSSDCEVSANIKYLECLIPTQHFLENEPHLQYP